jgi:hypothetical protein
MGASSRRVADDIGEDGGQGIAAGVGRDDARVAPRRSIIPLAGLATTVLPLAIASSTETDIPSVWDALM